MKTLYMVRHGESEGNARNIYQRENTSLSEQGRKQAVILRKRFEHILVDALYVSPLNRARETAEIVNESLRLSIQATDLVREWRKPSSLLEKLVEGEEAEEFHSALRLYGEDPYWKWQDEESSGEVRDRVVAFLKEMKCIPQKNILVIMHSIPLKMILSVVLFGPKHIPFKDKSSSFHVHTSNTGITVLQLPDGKRDWELITWNDRAHLGE